MVNIFFSMCGEKDFVFIFIINIRKVWLRTTLWPSLHNWLMPSRLRFRYEGKCFHCTFSGNLTFSFFSGCVSPPSILFNKSKYGILSDLWFQNPEFRYQHSTFVLVLRDIKELIAPDAILGTYLVLVLLVSIISICSRHIIKLPIINTYNI